MRTKYLLALALPVALLIAWASVNRGQGQRLAVDAQNNSVGQKLELIAMRPFVLDESYVHFWRTERPSFFAGYLLVLKADAAFLRPRQGLEPVLFVGSETAERLNNPTDSGYLVCLVPSALAGNQQVSLKPLETLIWFGVAELPERIDAGRAKAELALAKKLGVRGLGEVRDGDVTRLANGFASPSATSYMRNRDELDLIVADLLESYSPLEMDLIESLRMPLTR